MVYGLCADSVSIVGEAVCAFMCVVMVSGCVFFVWLCVSLVRLLGGPTVPVVSSPRQRLVTQTPAMGLVFLSVDPGPQCGHAPGIIQGAIYHNMRSQVRGGVSTPPTGCGVCFHV